ncbi:MAG: DMT family transporter [Proteobacteria bacterium]|nr:DMT family transporter [Pseudomonadota bacterium]
MAIEKLQDDNRELTLLTVAAVVPLTMFFGANAVAIRAGLANIGVFYCAGLRFGLASIVLIVWALATRRPLAITGKQCLQMAILAFIFVVQISLFYFGLSKSFASRGTLIVNSQPFFVLVLAHFFIPGDRITLRKVTGILLAFLGIVFVFWEKKGLSAGFRTGDILILVSAFMWGINAIYTKRIIAGYKPFQIALYPMILAVPFYFLEGWMWDGAMVVNWNRTMLLSLGYQVLTASVGFVIWNTLLQKYGAVSLHTFVFIIPVSGVLFGGLILGEPVTYKILIALALIAAGLLAVHLKQDRFPPIFPLSRNV